MKNWKMINDTVDHDDFDWDEILNLKDTTDTASVPQNADSDTESVRQIIKYIQTESKVYRTEIKYTGSSSVLYGSL